MKHKLVVFDWNGTLLSDTTASWQAANVCLEFYGKAPISRAHYLETFHFPVMHFYVKNGCSVDEILARKDEGNTLFHDTYEGLAQNCRTRRGAREILEWLRARDISCIILSNYLTEKIENHLRRLGIAGFFQHIDAHDDDGTTILQSTTKIERLSAFMIKRGYKPGDMVIIGDSMEEPDIGRHLGLTSVGITGGTISENRLRAARPDHIISHLQALGPLLAEKWGLPL
jgi:phosphoglycolate phosphatase